MRRGTGARRRAHRAGRSRARPRRARGAPSATTNPASRSSAAGGDAGTRFRRETSHQSAKAAASTSRPNDRTRIEERVVRRKGQRLPGRQDARESTDEDDERRRTSRCRAVLRSARSAGANGSLRRRPRTTRSTTPSANGTTARMSVSRAVQPLAARSAKNTLSGVRNAPPTLRSSELDECFGRAPELTEPRDVRTRGRRLRRASVVIVTAERPSARKRPCSSSANGIPRSTSCAGTDGSAGAVPSSSAIRADAVRTSVRAGVTGSSPAIASLGRPGPRSSTTTTASASAARGDSATKRAAPAPPNAPASVETRASV